MVEEKLKTGQSNYDLRSPASRPKLLQTAALGSTRVMYSKDRREGRGLEESGPLS